LVQFRVAKLQRRLRITRRELLPQKIGDVVGSEGTGSQRLLEGSRHRRGTIQPNQLEKFGDLAGEGAMGVGQASQVGFDGFLRAVSGEQGDQALLGLRTLGGSPVGQQLFLEALGTEGLTTLPAARVTDDFLRTVIKRHRGSIGFNEETLTYEMRRGTVAIPVEMQAKILLHPSLGGVAVIRREGGQRSQAVGAEAITGALSGFAVESLISDLVQPLPRLPVDLGEVGKVAEGPEVLTEVAYATTFHLSFLPTSGRIASSGIKIALAGKGQEARIEAHQGTDVFGDDGQEIVVPTFASDATQSLKSMEVATDEGLEALTVGELDVEHSTVALDQAEGIELPLITLIVEGSEMAPVDLEALTG